MGFSFALANSEGLVEIVHLHSLARAFAACSLKVPSEIFRVFLSSADFFKISFFKKSFKNTICVSNRLDTDQAQQNMGPDLYPNCFQRLSADDSYLCLPW